MPVVAIGHFWSVQGSVGQEKSGKNCVLRTVKTCYEILVKLEESQKSYGIFIIHAIKFFGAQKTTLQIEKFNSIA